MNVRDAIFCCGQSRCRGLGDQLLARAYELGAIARLGSRYMAHAVAASIEGLGWDWDQEISDSILSLPDAVCEQQRYLRAYFGYLEPTGPIDEWDMANGYVLQVRSPERAAQLEALGFFPDLDDPLLMRSSEPVSSDAVMAQSKALYECWGRKGECPDVFAPEITQLLFESPADGFGVVPVLMRGDMSPAVGSLQMALKRRFKLSDADYKPDLRFGRRTEGLVRQLQGIWGEAATGLADTEFIKRMKQEETV